MHERPHNEEELQKREPEEWEMIREDPIYQTFELWENLQDLRGARGGTETVELMAKGFIDKILGEEKSTTSERDK